MRDLGILLYRAVVVHHEEHIASQQLYVTCIVILKKHITFFSKKWQSHRVNNLCNVAGTVYFTLQKHQM